MFCFAFVTRAPLRCSFLRKYVSELPGQSILPITPCQILCNKSTAQSTLSPIVSYKCRVMTSGQLWSPVDKWKSNSRVTRSVLVHVRLFRPAYKPGLVNCVDTNPIGYLPSQMNICSHDSRRVKYV